MLSQEEITRQFTDFHFSGMGSVNHSDVSFLCELISDYRPKRMLELGVASGMSSAFMLRALARVSADCHLDSADLGIQYYVDKSKKVGYLVDEIVPNPKCSFALHRGKWAGDVESISGGVPYDLVFIDANHTQPWPTLDTILTLPHVNQNAWIAHHDIRLKDMAEWAIGIGPHYVFEAFPTPKKEAESGKRNIGAFQIVRPYKDYESYLIDAMQQPWTVRQAISPRFADRIFEHVAAHYSPEFSRTIREMIEKGNEQIAARQGRKSA